MPCRAFACVFFLVPQWIVRIHVVKCSYSVQFRAFCCCGCDELVSWPFASNALAWERRMSCIVLQHLQICFLTFCGGRRPSTICCSKLIFLFMCFRVHPATDCLTLRLTTLQVGREFSSTAESVSGMVVSGVSPWAPCWRHVFICIGCFVRWGPQHTHLFYVHVLYLYSY